MTWKHNNIFLKYYWILNISEILQGVLHMYNILELLLKYHFDVYDINWNLIRFPLFQNVNRNFFCLKYEQRAQSFFKNLAELWKEKSWRNLECVSKQFKKVCYSLVIDHIHLMIMMMLYIL